MKTKLIIEIETPDKFELKLEPDEEYEYTDGKEFAKAWHKGLVNVIKNIDDAIDNFMFDSQLEDFLDENGDLPEKTINVKELIDDGKKVGAR